MWFAKLFGGGRDDDHADDEPAQFPSAPTARREPPRTAPGAAAKPKLSAQPKVNSTAAKGFDPYNSGAFERRNAWERISRR